VKQGRIDWTAVRQARTRLAQLAHEHPELTGPSSPENVEAWQDALRQEETRMVPNKPATMTEHTAIRLPPHLLEHVDAYRDQVAKASGFRPSRADVFRLALERFLEAEAKGVRRSR